MQCIENKEMECNVLWKCARMKMVWECILPLLFHGPVLQLCLVIKCLAILIITNNVSMCAHMHFAVSQIIQRFSPIFIVKSKSHISLHSDDICCNFVIFVWHFQKKFDPLNVTTFEFHVCSSRRTETQMSHDILFWIQYHLQNEMK